MIQKTHQKVSYDIFENDSDEPATQNPFKDV